MINKLEKSSFIILLITIILAPLAFIPSTYVSVDMVKTVVITVGILISSILYFISSLKTKELAIPKSPLFVLGCGVIISIIISTLLSPNILKSFYGQGFEIGTASFLILMFLSSLMVIYTTHKSRDRALYIFGALVVSFVIIAILHVVRLFVGLDHITLGILQSATSTILGKWNDIAIFSGVVAILSYIALRFIKLKTVFKVLLVVLMLICGFFIFLVNSVLVWSTTLIVLTMISIYEFYISTVSGNGIASVLKRIPVITAILIALTIVGIWKGDSLASGVITKFNIRQTEVLLPWQLTLDINSATIKTSPFFGAGPNRFTSQYLRYKPAAYVNPTIFWNTEFNSGFSLIATFVVTQGIVGALLWLILIVSFAYAGLKSLQKTTDHLSRFFIASTFFSSSFLWLMMLVYVPSHATVFLTFILSGLFIASLVHDGQVSTFNLSSENSSVSKFFPVVVIIILAVFILWLGVYVKKTLALTYFQGGISALNLPNGSGIQHAEDNFRKALSLDKVDTYYQALSEVDILKINSIAQAIQSQKAGTAPDPESVKKIGLIIDEAMQYTKDAVAIDPTNYYNYIAQARISAVAMTLQIQGSYEATKAAYKNAISYNPYDPSLFLSLARVEVTQNKLAEAEKYIGASLQLKQNYLDAIFLLSQIQVSLNQIKDAITSVQVASQINPTNPQIFFQLGFLYYNDKNYQGAIDALSQAIKLDNKYANAQYFLGLSYARVNNYPDAIIQFEALAISNPDNQEVKLILLNLKNGKSPFADAKPPIDSKPEKRSSLPIKTK